MPVKVCARWMNGLTTEETVALLPPPSETISFMSAETGAHMFRYDPDAVDELRGLPVIKEEPVNED